MSPASRYELLDKVGSGGFATVYRARDTELGREVAVKQIHEQYLSDPKQLDRYWQEAQLLASLHHPNIVTIFDIQRDRGWLIMELMQANLRQRLAGRQMDLKSLRTTLAHSLRALKYLHSLGIVHGDIKPSNMMVDARRRVKIGDFGLARRVSDEEGSLLKGTTKYMAPEVVSEEFGEVGPASDLYSLGFSAYELICGSNFETLFPGLSAFGRNKQIAWMMWHAAADRRLPEIHRVLEGVPDDLQHVIQKLIEKDQTKRYGSADEALAGLNIDVKVVKDGEPSGDDADESLPDEAARKRRFVAIGAFAGSLLLCLVMLFLPGGKPAVVQETRTYGVIREVLLDQHRLVIEDVETGIPEEVDLGEKPHIFFRNARQNILLRELKAGDRVEIEKTRSSSGKPLVNVTADRAIASRGRLSSVDLPNQRVIVTVEKGVMRGELPLRIPQRAIILLNTKPIKLRDLGSGDCVEVTHFDAVGSTRGRVVERLAASRLAEAAGFVDRFDPASDELLIRFGRGSVSRSLKLPLADDCEILRQDTDSAAPTPLEISDLKPGGRIRFSYDTHLRKILVAPEMVRVTGVVEDVDPASRTLDVRASDGQQVTFTTDAGGEIWLSQEPIDLSGLRKFDDVDVFHDETANGRRRAMAIDASRPIKNDRWAIVIGVQAYRDSFLTPLSYSLSSANLVRDVFLERYAVNPDRLLMLLDETGSEMKTRIETCLRSVRSQTQLVVYVSSHAFAAEDGRVYLAGRDFNWDRMAETGLALEWLAEQLETCASQDKILLFDCSHAGTGKDLQKQPSTAAMLESLTAEFQTTTAVASCSGTERGLSWKDHRHSVFAHFLAQGFGGKADGDRDLHITADEIFRFLSEQMGQADLPGKATQTPARFGVR